MPVMDGYQAAAAIREMVGDYLPIIALTANTMPEDLQACFKAGMNEVLGKPFDRKKLQALLAEYGCPQLNKADDSPSVF